MIFPSNPHPTCRCLISPKPAAADDSASRTFVSMICSDVDLDRTIEALLALFPTPMPEVVGTYLHHRSGR